MKIKNENRPGYKKTKVGWIPEGWEEIRLREIGGNIRHAIVDGPFGSNLKSIHYKETGIPVIQSGFVTSGQFKAETYLFVDHDLFETQKRSAVRGGDIVMAKIGAQAGRCAIMPDGHPISILAGNCLKITANKKRFHTHYTCMLLHRAYALSGLSEIKTETAQPAISLKNLKSFYLAYPPLPEQEAIAEVLECWNKGIRTLEKKIVKKRLIKKGLMQRLLSGDTRLPGFSKPWKNVRLGDLCHIQTGARDNQNKVEGGKYPFFVRSEEIERIDTYSYDGEAILIPGEGKIGDIFHYINGKFDFHQRVYKLSQFEKNICAGIFIFFYLRHFFKKEALKHSVKATVDSLRLPTFKNFEIHLPPIEEQRAIAVVLSAADWEIEALEKKLALWKEQKKYLLNNLVTGTLRLPQFVTANDANRR